MEEWEPDHSILFGIIGGIGPAATSKLVEYIQNLVPATQDSDHIPLLIYMNPQIPNNNAAVLGGLSSIPAMIYTAKRLQKAGCTHLVIPCNTAHVFYDQVQTSVSTPLLNMITLTVDMLHERGFHTVGLMGTLGTLQSKVYDTALLQAGTLLW